MKSKPVPTLNLIGAGRVGKTLARLWQQSGCMQVQDVLTRSLESGQAACGFIGAGRAHERLETMATADFWMLAVPDAGLGEAASRLASEVIKKSADGASSPCVFHCSGALGASALEALRLQGWQIASAHCILSFADPASACQQFPGTPCALEGEASATALLRGHFSAIGAQCFAVAAEDKLLYHAGAVFATNFLPVLQALAEAAWRSSGVPDALLPGLRASLLQNAVANITRLGPAGALTGPAARGDLAAIARQASVVEQWDAGAGAAYRALSDLALRLANTSKTTEASAASTFCAGAFSSKSI